MISGTRFQLTPVAPYFRLFCSAGLLGPAACLAGVVGGAVGAAAGAVEVAFGALVAAGEAVGLTPGPAHPLSAHRLMASAARTTAGARNQMIMCPLRTPDRRARG